MFIIPPLKLVIEADSGCYHYNITSVVKLSELDKNSVRIFNASTTLLGTLQVFQVGSTYSFLDPLSADVLSIHATRHCMEAPPRGHLPDISVAQSLFFFHVVTSLLYLLFSKATHQHFLCYLRDLRSPPLHRPALTSGLSLSA